MAQRRMFSKEITNSSDFLMMSQSAQNLYFHFGMNADDDGFCEVFTIMRMTDSKPDDLQSLHTRGFIFVADSKVCIVKDWHENNQLRSDRYKSSKYLEDPKYKELYMIVMEEKIKEIGLYQAMLSSWQPNGNQMATQYSIDKGSIGEEREEKNINNIAETSSADSSQVNEILNSFKEEINPTISFGNKTQRKACEELIKQFGFEKVVNTLNYYKTIRGEKFSPVITTPCQLRDKMGQLIAYYEKNKSNITIV